MFIECLENQWFELSQFCHIWIEKSINGFFLMGEWIHNGEEVVLSPSFEFKECLKLWMKNKGVL